MADRITPPLAASISGLPLMMGDKIVGRASLDYETGKLEADMDKDLMKILAEGLGNGLLQITFYGRPAFPVAATEAQEKLRKYLYD